MVHYPQSRTWLPGLMSHGSLQNNHKKQPDNLEERKFGWLGPGNPKKRSFEKWEHLVLTTSLSRSLYAHPSLPSLCSSTHSLFWLWASLTLVQQSLGVVVARCLCCVDDSVGLRSLRVSPCQPRRILGEWRYNNKPWCLVTTKTINTCIDCL